MSERSPTVARAANGFIVHFEYADGGAAAAHGDPEVQSLWTAMAEISEMLGLHALPESKGTLPGIALQ